MGNEECCLDREKGGEFNRGTTSIHKPDKRSGSLKNSSDLNQSLRSNQSNKYPAQTKSTLPPKMSNQEIVERKEQPILNQDLSDSFLKYAEKQQPKDIPNLDSGSHQVSFAKEQKQSSLSKEKEDPNDKSLKQLQKSSLLINLPELNEKVKKTYKSLKSFTNLSLKNAEVREFGGEIYDGQITNSIPNGFGKFYKKDQSLYIGNFTNGKAQGQGVYIFPDGSYFLGSFKNNQATCTEGQFNSERLVYKGDFQNNQFHGKGYEHGPYHKFEGTYCQGFKAQGNLEWYQNQTDFFSYQGTFNERGVFHSKGKLTEPTGVYQGTFQNGQKHGEGTYRFTNGITYIGEYMNNKREGKGKLLNPKNKTAYEGQFCEGLPHGDGFIVDKEGNKQPSKWIMGIDCDIL